MCYVGGYNENDEWVPQESGPEHYSSSASGLHFPRHREIKAAAEIVAEQKPWWPSSGEQTHQDNG